MIYDVAIIGAGVVGGLAAYQLSKYKLNIAVVEKNPEASMGASCANSGIVHSGYDAEEGTLKAKLNVAGNAMMDTLCEELDVPMKRNGSLTITFTEEDEQAIGLLYQRGLHNGVPNLQLLSAEEILAREPLLNDQVRCALYAPTAGIISPFELAIAAVEGAALNGAELFFNTEAVSISDEKDVVVIRCKDKEIQARFVLNCAGIQADWLSNETDFSIQPKKGEYLLFDRKFSNILSHTIFSPPTKMGKGILLAPTVHGNLLLGPTSEYTLDREDTDTSREGLETVADKGRSYLPTLNTKYVITSFAGLRASSNRKDFLIDFAQGSRRQINAAGIESPGLTASPAIALMLRDMLEGAGLELQPKKAFIKREKVIRLKEMPIEKRNELIKANPSYGKIVCRCEQISEGEIIEAIRRGAVTTDGIKRRVRAGMGRCQGGFCLTSVIELLSKELGIDSQSVTKKGGSSNYITGMNR